MKTMQTVLFTSLLALAAATQAEVKANVPGVNVQVGADGSVKTDVNAGGTGVSSNVGTDGSVKANVGDAIKVDVSGKMADAAVQAADIFVEVEEPYVRAVPAGQPNSAAFMTLVNDSMTAYKLKSASSPVAETVELHTHTNNNGVMEMRKIDEIEIPAGGKVELKPGGLHIMLIGLKQELKVGEEVEITLNYADGSSEKVEAEIKEVTPPAGMGGHGGHGSHGKGHGTAH